MPPSLTSAVSFSGTAATAAHTQVFNNTDFWQLETFFSSHVIAAVKG